MNVVIEHNLPTALFLAYPQVDPLLTSAIDLCVQVVYKVTLPYKPCLCINSAHWNSEPTLLCQLNLPSAPFPGFTFHYFHLKVFLPYSGPWFGEENNLASSSIDTSNVLQVEGCPNVCICILLFNCFLPFKLLK